MVNNMTSVIWTQKVKEPKRLIWYLFLNLRTVLSGLALFSFVSPIVLCTYITWKIKM